MTQFTLNIERQIPRSFKNELYTIIADFIFIYIHWRFKSITFYLYTLKRDKIFRIN